MSHSVRKLASPEVLEIIYKHGFHVCEGEENDIWQRCIAATSSTWIGLVDGKVACLWGIIPPTLLSDRCYLWLSTTEILKGNEFIFTRRSQRFIEELLKEYSEVFGHVKAGQDRSIRWLKWLGAEFDEPDGLFIPFFIRKK